MKTSRVAFLSVPLALALFAGQPARSFAASADDAAGQLVIPMVAYGARFDTRVFVQNNALRAASAEVTGRLLRGEPVDPSEVYFRGQVTLETGDPRWSWLNERLYLCVGQRLPTQVLMTFYIVQ